MYINGRRVHLSERYAPQGGTTRTPAPPLAPRASPDQALAVIWYPHRDAPSLLAPMDDAREDVSFTRVRGAIQLPIAEELGWMA